MAETQLIQLDNSQRTKVLEKLGYLIDEEGFVVEKTSKKEVICRYSKERVHINTAAIMPGSVLVFNATPLTMAQYFVEHSNDG